MSLQALGVCCNGHGHPHDTELPWQLLEELGSVPCKSKSVVFDLLACLSVAAGASLECAFEPLLAPSGGAWGSQNGGRVALEQWSPKGRFAVVLRSRGEELIGFVVTSRSCQELTSALVTDEDITVTGSETAQLASQATNRAMLI
ncbi:unnamed protein product [Rangifer tarandus platyrhynchus]|uniref:Uncharacterized protein n=3 Tax=Rangifer tarandus platyrhynchus TaxID=3082113 RepID=A0AC59YJG1_RANTA|nr:unnamed protein product [Rangifer tarandus platyrhynchus]CAI9696169.1 unnamed protein product [Rangifer tarandus platyrhynchus]